MGWAERQADRAEEDLEELAFYRKEFSALQDSNERMYKLLDSFVKNNIHIYASDPFQGVLERLLDLAAAECAAWRAQNEPTGKKIKESN